VAFRAHSNPSGYSAMLSRILAAAPLVLLGACTTFGSVRSAEVNPGGSVAVQGTVSSPPGDGAAWFWGLDCSVDCDRPVGGGDASLTLGTTAAGRPVSVGAGMSGIYPYVEGFAQLSRPGRNPWGLGVRAGVPLTSWTEHQLFARYDLPLRGETRLLLNPALFIHTGASPNGENDGTLVAFVQGVGLLHRRPGMSVIPSLSLAVGRGERDTRFGDEGGPFTTAFGTASVSVVLHRRR